MKCHGRSLWWHLFAWSLAAVLVGWTASVVLTSRASVQQASEHTDELLTSVASMLARQGGTEFVKSWPSQSPQKVSVFVWDASGRLLTSAGSAPQLPFSSKEGFSTVAISSSPQIWRSWTQWDTPERNRKVGVMVQLPDRENAVDIVIAGVTTPAGWLLPGFAALIGIAIYFGLRPLREVCDELEGNGAPSSPIEMTPYAELNRVVGAFNAVRQSPAVVPASSAMPLPSHHRPSG